MLIKTNYRCLTFNIYFLSIQISTINKRPDNWKKREYSIGAYSALAKSNACDVEMYQIAQEIFWRRVGAML